MSDVAEAPTLGCVRLYFSRTKIYFMRHSASVGMSPVLIASPLIQLSFSRLEPNFFDISD